MRIHRKGHARVPAKQPTMQPVMESLEAREMLTATLSNSVLTVKGTRSADVIKINVDRINPKRLRVNVDGQVSKFWRSGVRAVRVFAGAGDDCIKVGDIGLKASNVRVDGGLGRDLLFASLAVARYATSVVLAASSATAAPFTVYDGTLFDNKPDLSSSGLKPIYIAYNDEPFVHGTDPVEWNEPNEQSVRELARKAADLNQVLVFDIENWMTNGYYVPASEVLDSVRKMSLIADWVHSERPQVRMGFYGLIPATQYWVTQRNDPVELEYLKEANDLLKPVAEKVDMLFPEMYVVYDDPNGWMKYAQKVIADARAFGKPVVPFVTMRYHDIVPELSGAFLPDGLWRTVLDTTRGLADGVLIWSDHEPWDESAEWWQTVREFMNEPPLPPVSASNVQTTSGDLSIGLTWTDRASNEGRYVIQRSLDGVSYETVQLLPADTTSWVDHSVLAGRDYSYRVRARNSYGADSSPLVVQCRAFRVATDQTEAELFDDKLGGDYVTSTSVSYLFDGNWLKYSDMVFDPRITQFNVNLSALAEYAGKTLELRLDAPDGILIGSMTIQATGDWYTYVVQTTPVTLPKYFADLYLVFQGGPHMAAVDWFTFS